MTYNRSTRQARRAAQMGNAGAAASVRTGTATYLVFALSVAFTGAVVLGLLA